MDEERKMKIWEEILQEAKERRTSLLPNERTLKMIMEETGLTKDRARAFVIQKIKQGILYECPVILNGVRCKAYGIIDHSKDTHPHAKSDH